MRWVGDLEVPLLLQMFSHFACFKAQLHPVWKSQNPESFGGFSVNLFGLLHLPAYESDFLGLLKSTGTSCPPAFQLPVFLPFPLPLFLSLRVDAIHYAKSPVTVILLVFQVRTWINENVRSIITNQKLPIFT